MFFALISFTLILAWLPESPRYYYGKKMFDKCRVVMASMSKFNLGKPIHFEFE